MTKRKVKTNDNPDGEAQADVTSCGGVVFEVTPQLKGLGLTTAGIPN